MENSDFTFLIQHLQRFQAARINKSREVRGWHDPLEWQIKSGNLQTEAIALLRLYALLPYDEFPLEILIPLLPGLTLTRLKKIVQELEEHSWLTKSGYGYLLFPATREAVFTFLQPQLETCRTSIVKLITVLNSRDANWDWYRLFAQSITAYCNEPDIDLAALNWAAGKAELKTIGFKQAGSYFQKAREMYTHLQKPLNLAATLCLLGQNERLQRKPEQAMVQVQEAEKILTKLLEQKPENQTVKTWLAGVWYEQGAAWQELDNPEQAMVLYRQACEIYQLLYRDDALNLDAEINYYYSASNLGQLYSSQQEYPQALQWYQMALDLVEELNHRFPDEAMNLVDLPMANYNIAQVFEYLEDKKQALDYYLQAKRLMQDTLVEDHEDNGCRMTLVETLNKIGFLHLDLKNTNKAMDCFHMSLDLCLELQKNFRYAPALKQSLARSCLNLGIIYRGRQEIDKSIEYLQPGLDVCCELDLNVNENYILTSNLWTEMKTLLSLLNREEDQPRMSKQFLLQTITLVRKLHNHTHLDEFTVWVEKIKNHLENNV